MTIKFIAKLRKTGRIYYVIIPSELAEKEKIRAGCKICAKVKPVDFTGQQLSLPL